MQNAANRKQKKIIIIIRNDSIQFEPFDREIESNNKSMIGNASLCACICVIVTFVFFCGFSLLQFSMCVFIWNKKTI